MTREGGPGLTRSDLLVINKIDLAPYVGASLDQMEQDAQTVRGGRPFVFTNMKDSSGLSTILAWVHAQLANPTLRRTLTTGGLVGLYA